MKDMQHLHLQIRLTIFSGDESDDATFGKGIATLLGGVEKYGSLNAAAKDIKMAYSKAWRIVKETESGFGFELIDRDGARGSKLTEEGEKLLRAYNELEITGKKYFDEKFRKLVD